MNFIFSSRVGFIMTQQSFSEQFVQAFIRKKKRDKFLGNVSQSSKGKCKISEALLEFAQPILSVTGDESQEVVESAVSLATMCWNIGAYPEDEGKEMLDEMVSQIIREHMASSGNDEDEDIDGSRVLFCELLDSMVEQRRTVFSDDSRFVMDFDVLRENGGYRLKVFSSVVPPTLFD
ncbi:hypothetical protein [Endozoicomonas acroporae]|uniref:hypothetical protein n=2 Tax=Endozoicomonas acroporae TaxID=1701104 RepID=UPI000C7844AE|nr:hypothetical protein [Endozoicomonas acroporae]